MPYIKNEDREKFENDIVNIAKNVSNAGDINYVFTSILQEYLKKVGVRYANINEIIGALECTKLEFYDRIARIYENRCIELNGDVMRVDVPKPKSI